ncbi:mutator type transposase [Tanacetum coccineum]
MLTLLPVLTRVLAELTCHFLIPSLGLDYGLHSLNVDADVLEMSKYVKDYKIILVYVKHGSSIVDTSMFDSSPDVNRNPASFVARRIVVESVIDPFDGLNEILGDYANTGKQITRDESTWKQMVVYVGTNSTADDFLFGKFKEVEVEVDTESEEEESDTEGNDTSDPKHDTSIGAIDVQEDDLDVIDYDSFGSDLDDGIDSKRRIQLRELRRIGKQKNKGLNKYYFYLGQQFASKEIMKERVKKHLVEARRQLILVKNDNERVRVRCKGRIPALVPYVAIDTNMDKNVFS